MKGKYTESNISELRTAVSVLYKCLRKQMHSASSHSMTEIETMGILFARGNVLPSELARNAKITMPSMSQMLHKMEEMGLIKYTPSADDGRKKYVSLTPEGIRQVEQTRYERDKWLEDGITNMLTAQETELLFSAVPILKKLACSTN